MINHFAIETSYIYTRFHGDVLTLDSTIEWVREFLGHPKFYKNSPVLWDATPVAHSTLSFGDMQKFGDYIHANKEKRGGGRSAFVTNNDLVFGLFRTHEMLNRGKYEYDYRVFRDLALARQWVSGSESYEEADV